MSTFDKFKKAVREAYLEKKSLNKLHGKINNPSPANLRDYSLIRWTEGLTPEDLIVYKNYYNPLNRYENIEQAIRKVDLNQLKSLQNFIIGETSTRSEEIVKMVAILIDFPRRPYKSADWIETNISGDLDESNLYEEDDVTQAMKQENEPAILEESKDCEETVTFPEGQIKYEEELINPDNLVKDQKNVEGKTVHVADATSTVIDNQTIDKDSPIIKDQGKHSNGDNAKVEETPLSEDNLFRIKGLYGTSAEESKLPSNTDGSARVHTTAVSAPNPMKGKTFFRNKANYPYGGLIIVIIAIVIYSFINKECMCWNGERYKEVDCKNNIQANEIIALNEDKLHNFQKIMRPDTLSKADVGKVWYSKIDNEVEFFTHSGYHPVHSKKPLKAATEHIINTWAGRKSLNLDNKSIEALP